MRGNATEAFWTRKFACSKNFPLESFRQIKLDESWRRKFSSNWKLPPELSQQVMTNCRGYKINFLLSKRLGDFLFPSTNEGKSFEHCFDCIDIKLLAFIPKGCLRIRSLKRLGFRDVFITVDSSFLESTNAFQRQAYLFFQFKIWTVFTLMIKACGDFNDILTELFQLISPASSRLAQLFDVILAKRLFFCLQAFFLLSFVFDCRLGKREQRNLIIMSMKV